MGETTPMVKVWKLTTDGGVRALIVAANALDVLFEEVRRGKDDDVYTVRVAMMPRSELEALGEFDGY